MKSEKKIGLIDIHVSDREANGCFYVSFLQNESPSGDPDPEPWGDTEEHSTRAEALSSARQMADYVVETGIARRAVVFANGSDDYSRGERP